MWATRMPLLEISCTASSHHYGECDCCTTTNCTKQLLLHFGCWTCTKACFLWFTETTLNAGAHATLLSRATTSFITHSPFTCAHKASEKNGTQKGGRWRQTLMSPIYLFQHTCVNATSPNFPCFWAKFLVLYWTTSHMLTVCEIERQRSDSSSSTSPRTCLPRCHF